MWPLKVINCGLQWCQISEGFCTPHWQECSTVSFTILLLRFHCIQSSLTHLCQALSSLPWTSPFVSSFVSYAHQNVCQLKGSVLMYSSWASHWKHLHILDGTSMQITSLSSLSDQQQAEGPGQARPGLAPRANGASPVPTGEATHSCVSKGSGGQSLPAVSAVCAQLQPVSPVALPARLDVSRETSVGGSPLRTEAASVLELWGPSCSERVSGCCERVIPHVASMQGDKVQ